MPLNICPYCGKDEAILPVPMGKHIAQEHHERPTGLIIHYHPKKVVFDDVYWPIILPEKEA